MLIVEPEVGREPKNERLICNRVGQDDEQLDRKGEPQLALSSLEDGELRDETAQAFRYDRRDAIFRHDRGHETDSLSSLIKLKSD